jgi:hypothetical protein
LEPELEIGALKLEGKFAEGGIIEAVNLSNFDSI